MTRSRSVTKIIASRIQSGEKLSCYECEKEPTYVLRTGQSKLWFHFYCPQHAASCAKTINRSLYWLETIQGTPVDFLKFDKGNGIP